ncbi:MAG: hypothetical protein R2788_15355 [Saprospiraceae bacterium]
MMLSDFQLKGGLRDQVFSKTFNYLNQFVQEANKEALSPFVPNSDTELIGEMAEYLQSTLPETLKGFAQKCFPVRHFAVWKVCQGGTQ